MNPVKKKYYVRPMALVVLILIGLPGTAWTKNLRLAGTIGYTPVNEAADGNGIITGGGVHLAYPVSDPGKTVHTEFSINNWYSFLPGNEYMHCLRFGFGIRVFYNGFEGVLPYFTHDILTHILWIEGREGYAPTYGILLGLGVAIPMGGEDSSFFCDLSYNCFDLVFSRPPNVP